VLGRYRVKFATDEFDTIAVPGLDDLSLREPRVAPPASVAPFCTTDRYDRGAHTYGKSYPDYVRAMLGDYNYAPDVVAWRTAGALSVCRRQAVAGAPRRDRCNRRRHPPPRRSSRRRHHRRPGRSEGKDALQHAIHLHLTVRGLRCHGPRLYAEKMTPSQR
jgi:hypothetical protein